jgi:hypothetical protein
MPRAHLMQPYQTGGCMPQEDPRQSREYEETVDPKNPPNSVLQPQVRTAAVSSFVGGIVVFFLIVAAALVYWTASHRRIAQDPGDRTPPGATAGDEVGTVGETTAGGQDPAPRPGSTRDELEYRGGNSPDAARPLTEVGMILRDKPQTTIGRRVDFYDVDVASVNAGSFWVHDGNGKVEVIMPQGAPSVRAGESVHVSGMVESDGGGGVRIRAARVDR